MDYLNRKYIYYFLIVITFIFPIISIEDIIPWIISLVCIHKDIKSFREKGELKPIIKNTIFAGGVILIYNIVTRLIEGYLVKMWL